MSVYVDYAGRHVRNAVVVSYGRRPSVSVILNGRVYQGRSYTDRSNAVRAAKETASWVNAAHWAPVFVRYVIGVGSGGKVVLR